MNISEGGENTKRKLFQINLKNSFLFIVLSNLKNDF